jgi:riboflavin biosynthesis pyrimidine reductase
MTRPRVIVHSVASVDGRMTISPDTLLLFGDERWQAVAGSGDDAYQRIKALYAPQAMLEGSGSFMLEGTTPDPLPPVDGDPAPLYEDSLPDSVVHRPGQRGWFTAVDGRGRLRGMMKEFPDPEWEGWHLLVWVSTKTPPEYLASLRSATIPYLVAGANRVDLAAALAKMKEKLGVTCLVSTAGGKLNGALLRAGVVDEVSVEFFPALIGGTDTPSLFDSPALKADEMPTPLKLLAVKELDGGRVWLRYEVVRSG